MPAVVENMFDMADMVNPPLTYGPNENDIPASKVYGNLTPNPKILKENNLLPIANIWLSEFKDVIKNRNFNNLDKLIASHSAWKDHMCLSWTFHQWYGLEKIKSNLTERVPNFDLSNIEIDKDADYRFPTGVSLQTVHHPSNHNPVPIEWVQVYIKFKTKYGTGRGLLRLVSSDEKDSEFNGGLRLFTIFTTLDELYGNEQQLGERRPLGVNHGQHVGRVSWLERRKKSFEYGGDKQPTVLVIGGGQAGLSVSARLKVMGLDSLIIERNQRIGDNWRKRYSFLVLHDPVWADHLAYLNFPEIWPIYTPKDKLGDWFQNYADSLELNYWTNKTVVVKIIDNDSKEVSILKPKHLVMATGHSGEPNIPHFKGEDKFKGKIVHSSQHSTGKEYNGENAIVVGSCNSAHDIAQDFYEQGATVTMVQRSSTCIINAEKGAKVSLAGVYDQEGPKTETADMIAMSMPYKLMNLVHQQHFRRACTLEKDMIQKLTAKGFKLDSGYAGTGMYGKYFRRGGGYCIDVGASKLVADGKIRVKQGVEVERFTEDGVIFKDGSRIDNVSIVVLATGYSNMRNTAEKIFGEKVASKLNEIWGLDNEGEFRAIYRYSGHPNFWYAGGNLTIVRYYSRLLALKIIAQERGMIENLED
ncbi:hypothetical protein PACTADRAFT_81553 [Pachysolen tannophilus NRRL Y-2460]|uniref:FAD/NAD(P)-binding domain-containing protein n=1 Tax=Pachysolen tannophilus NRRL Y-2460 TaxID=669874 RepID=A0A1E4TTE1_PACTA|nr:hypothetical protein PACTADRAFT_81553 [Pachysolen tannophilus NRRL Y-2460]